MIDVRRATGSLADYVVEFPGLRIGIREMSLLGQEVYLWAELTGPVSRATLREAKKLLAAYGARAVVNVDSLDPVAVRFAAFFGFHPVAQQHNVLIMEKS